MKEEGDIIVPELALDAGAKRWEKAGFERYYFNFRSKDVGLEYETYKTGNVKSAYFMGDSISNNFARKLLGVLDDMKIFVEDGYLYVDFKYYSLRKFRVVIKNLYSSRQVSWNKEEFLSHIERFLRRWESREMCVKAVEFVLERLKQKASKYRSRSYLNRD